MGLFDDTSGIDWGQLASGVTTPDAASFDQRFPKPPSVMPPPMPVGPSAMQSPISPESLAATAAARGIPPPAQDLTPGPPPPIVPGDVGAALTGAPGAPMDITSAAQKAPMAAPAEAKKPDLATALRGVQAPKPPEVQKVSSPSAPRPQNTIKGGDLFAMLSALNAAPGAGGLKLPATLNEAIKR